MYDEKIYSNSYCSNDSYKECIQLLHGIILTVFKLEHYKVYHKERIEIQL
jgi:hypothetical protein